MGCAKAGLVLRTDAIGNMFARWRGSEPDAPVVGTGSHIDAIPNAGKFDGVVGVLGGLEAIPRAAGSWVPAEAFDRATRVCNGRTDAVRYRMSWKPDASRHSFSPNPRKT